MDNELIPQENTALRIGWLMLARVSIITFLLGIAIFSELKGVELLPERSLSFYYIIIIATYLLSFFYLFLRSLVTDIKSIIYTQAAGDVAIITYMVYVTGGTGSIYSVFYALVIIYSVLFLGRGGGLIIATACSVSYGALLELESYHLIHPLNSVLSDYPFLSGYVFSRIVTHALSFYLTAVLAIFVVEKERRVRSLLAAKEDAFNQLDLLHRSIVESVSVGILTVNLSGRIKSFNRAAQDITGYGVSDVEGREFSKIFPLDPALLPRQDGRPEPAANRFEVAFQTKQDRMLVLGCSLSTLKDSRGERIGDIMIFQDLTSIKRMEEQYEKGRRMAFIGEMAAHLAHEIRNPLASISGSIQVLSRDLHLPESDEKLMRIILRGKEQLENFVKDFLLLARPRLSNPRAVDIKELMEETLDALQYVPDWHEGIAIRTSLAENARVFADRTEIRQVIWNLLLNALQAMPVAGTLDIETRLEGMPDNSAGVQITIGDSGCGIEEHHVQHIFEPFYTTKECGTGLGLAIVNRIIGSHQGKIEIFSEAGKGTRCVFSLPLMVDESNKD